MERFLIILIFTITPVVMPFPIAHSHAQEASVLRSFEFTQTIQKKPNLSLQECRVVQLNSTISSEWTVPELAKEAVEFLAARKNSTRKISKPVIELVGQLMIRRNGKYPNNDDMNILCLQCRECDE